MGKLWLAFALVIVWFGEAAAQDLPSMEAHLECFSGDKPLKNGKKQALAGDLRCLIGIDAGVVPDATSSARSSSTLTRFPLCPSAIVRALPWWMCGCAFDHLFAPVVE